MLYVAAKRHVKNRDKEGSVHDLGNPSDNKTDGELRKSLPHFSLNPVFSHSNSYDLGYLVTCLKGTLLAEYCLKCWCSGLCMKLLNRAAKT